MASLLAACGAPGSRNTRTREPGRWRMPYVDPMARMSDGFSRDPLSDGSGFRPGLQDHLASRLALLHEAMRLRGLGQRQDRTDLERQLSGHEEADDFAQ